MRARTKKLDTDLLNSKNDGVQYFKFKKQEKTYTAAFYSPNQSDFSRGADVFEGVEPRLDDVKKFMKIEVEKLLENSDFIVANFADSGKFSDKYLKTFKELAKEIKFRNISFTSSSNKDLSSVAKIIENLKENNKLLCL